MLSRRTVGGPNSGMRRSAAMWNVPTSATSSGSCRINPPAMIGEKGTWTCTTSNPCSRTTERMAARSAKTGMLRTLPLKRTLMLRARLWTRQPATSVATVSPTRSVTSCPARLSALPRTPRYCGSHRSDRASRRIRAPLSAGSAIVAVPAGPPGRRGWRGSPIALRPDVPRNANGAIVVGHRADLVTPREAPPETRISRGTSIRASERSCSRLGSLPAAPFGRPPSSSSRSLTPSMATSTT